MNCLWVSFAIHKWRFGATVGQFHYNWAWFGGCLEPSSFASRPSRFVFGGLPRRWVTSMSEMIIGGSNSRLFTSNILFVLFVSLLSHFWLIHLFYLHLLYQPYVGLLSSYMCSITPETVNVGSSYSHMRGPGVDCWLSDRSNCSHWSFEAAVLPINPNIYIDQWEPIFIYHSIT